MPSLSDNLRRILLRHPHVPCYWIAYSGGLDSHVLLHLCAHLRDEEKHPARFRAIHIHHGLQQDADAWSEHCAEVCRGLDMPFLAVRVDAHAGPGDSPEEAARTARYRAIRAQLAEGDAVLTAQHRDDQAETLLIQLMRGAGLAGLAAMPECAPFEPGLLLRPLLGFSRAQLREYGKLHGLHWIEDPSNEDLAYDRNFLRHEIIPLLEQRWPGLKKALARSAGHCAEAQRQWVRLADDLCRSVLDQDGQCLNLAKLRDFQEADQRLVLREWMRSRGYRMPSQAVIERILREILPAREDKTPAVSWREGEVRRYRNALYLLPPLPAFDASAELDWDGIVPLALPGNNGELSAYATEKPGISADAWQRGKITLRYRQGGERCRLAGRSGNHELKKLFQEAGVLPWLRERIPLIYIDGELAAVASWWTCQPYAGKAGESHIALNWRPPPDITGIRVPGHPS
ncbi:MAG: tRNA lysidine(34) synthetase TilS [Methylococcaceae bacterium]|nr:tRNA lysidine(34) synthetase TilS [Methylococcaceae bacterium]